MTQGQHSPSRLADKQSVVCVTLGSADDATGLMNINRPRDIARLEVVLDQLITF